MIPRPAQVRHSARVALERLRASFVFGVALVPALLTQVFLGVQDWLPWWGWSLVLLAAIVGLIALGLHADHRLRRRLAPVQGDVRSVRDPAAITDLVATAHLGKTTPQNVHTLVRALPGLRQVHLIVGESPHAAGDLPSAVDALMAGASRADLSVKVLQRLPIADIDPAAVAALQERLTALDLLRGPDERIAVDVTGGTTPMSLAVYRAAVGADLPVTYTSSLPPRATGDRYQFHALTALHDPRGELTGGEP